MSGPSSARPRYNERSVTSIEIPSPIVDDITPPALAFDLGRDARLGAYVDAFFGASHAALSAAPPGTMAVLLPGPVLLPSDEPLVVEQLGPIPER